MSAGDDAFHRARQFDAAAHYARAAAAVRGDGRLASLRAQSLCSEAAVERLEGRYTRAAELYRQSAALLEASAPVPALELSASVYNLAQALSLAGRSDEAAAAYRRFVAAAEPLAGTPILALQFESAGQFFHAQRDLAEALACYRRALAIEEKAPASEVPGLAGLREDIAAALADQAKERKAP